MKTTKKSYFFLFIILFPALLLISSCSKSKKARVDVYLTDAPATYEKVNIDIRQIHINNINSNGDNWIELPIIKPGIYNLLDFRNYLDTLLGTIELPAGKLSQMRMILGPNNTVVSGGNTYELQTPSSLQSGLKFNVNTEIVEGKTYQIWIDFDAGRSVVKINNNGKYVLKPKIREFTQSSSGSVKGVVKPDDANADIYVIKGIDTVAHAMPNSGSGAFLIRGIPQGTYLLSIVGNNGYKDQMISGVNVTTRNMTNVGTIKLKK